MHSQEGPQIALSDEDYSAYSVRNEEAVIDPSADRTGRDAKEFRDLRNLEKFKAVVTMMAMTAFAGSAPFRVAVDMGPRSIVADARPSSRGHVSAFSATTPRCVLLTCFAKR
jgi:hypothetical protein